MPFSTTVEGLERYSINLRYERDYRQDLQALRDLVVPAPTGAQVPLGQLASIRFAAGPPSVKSENAQLNSIVYVDVRGRDIGGYVSEAQELLRRELDLPPGYSLQWSGQYEAMQRANRTLRFVVPITAPSLVIVSLPVPLPIAATVSSTVASMKMMFTTRVVRNDAIHSSAAGIATQGDSASSVMAR